MSQYEFSTDWFSKYAPDWISCLSKCGIALDARRNVLELGSFEGRSACWISDNLLDHPQSRLTCVDTFCGSPEFGTMFSAIFCHARDNLRDRFRVNIKRSKNPDKVASFLMTTKAFMEMETKRGIEVYDLIYVDAGHHEHEAYFDGFMGYQLLRPDGLLIFDDYLWAPHFNMPVKAAVDRLEQELPMRCLHDGWQRIYQKTEGAMRLTA